MKPNLIVLALATAATLIANAASQTAAPKAVPAQPAPAVKTAAAPAAAPSAADAKLSDAEKREKLKAFIRERKQELLEKTGGDVVKPGTISGKIRFVNAQKKVPAEDLQRPIAVIGRQYRWDLALVESPGSATGFAEIESLKKKIGANVTVFIVDIPGFPALVTVPEGLWSAVNVAALGDAKTPPQFLAARTRKEMYRALAFVGGGANSRYDENLMAVITDVRQLDERRERGLPIDIYSRMQEYLEKLGVREGEWTTYLEALQEGWAPAPANDLQKKVKERFEAERKNAPKKPAHAKK